MNDKLILWLANLSLPELELLRCLQKKNIMLKLLCLAKLQCTNSSPISILSVGNRPSFFVQYKL